MAQKERRENKQKEGKLCCSGVTLPQRPYNVRLNCSISLWSLTATMSPCHCTQPLCHHTVTLSLSHNTVSHNFSNCSIQVHCCKLHNSCASMGSHCHSATVVACWHSVSSLTLSLALDWTSVVVIHHTATVPSHCHSAIVSVSLCNHATLYYWVSLLCLWSLTVMVPLKCLAHTVSLSLILSLHQSGVFHHTLLCHVTPPFCHCFSVTMVLHCHCTTRVSEFHCCKVV